jgi:hypothetical protein
MWPTVSFYDGVLIIEIVLVLFLLFADWKTIDSSSAAFSSIIFDHFIFEMYRNKLAVTQEQMSKSLELYQETHRHHPVRRPDSLLKTHLSQRRFHQLATR